MVIIILITFITVFEIAAINFSQAISESRQNIKPFSDNPVSIFILYRIYYAR